jgi:uncharacterized protein (TIGR02145 family)
MKKNLSTKVYRNGNPISRPNWSGWGNTTEGGYCVNNDLNSSLEVIENPLNDSLYGKLYNWYAVQDARGLCPAGWKVPSKEDFDTLIQAAGGPDSANRKLKTTGNKTDGTGLWLVCPGCPDGTDDLGFSALPGGYRLVGATYDYSSAGGNDARFWTTTTFTIPGWGLHAISLALVAFPQNYQVNMAGGYSVNHGVSVRCIKE